MKKMGIFAAIIIVLFGALAFVTTYQNKKESEGNPYGKDTLHPETIKLLEDKNYDNIVVEKDVDQIIADKKDAYVYFFSSTCVHCKRTTPIVSPLAKELGIDLMKFNLLEFEDGWDKYGIEATPTLVHYKDGKVVASLEGEQTKETFEKFFADGKAK